MFKVTKKVNSDKYFETEGVKFYIVRQVNINRTRFITKSSVEYKMLSFKTIYS
jgi:hypothetical protein